MSRHLKRNGARMVSFRGYRDYDIDSDSAFYHLCMTAHEGKLLASTRRDPAFLSKVIVHLRKVIVHLRST